MMEEGLAAKVVYKEQLLDKEALESEREGWGFKGG